MEKRLLKEYDRAYATTYLKLHDKHFVIYASEARPNEKGLALAYDIDDFDHPLTVWDDVGGCMGFAKDPLDQDSFYAIQEFYLKEVPSKAKVVHVTYKDGRFIVKDFIKMPLVHRIGILSDDDKHYLVMATVAKYKENKDDWSKSGQVYAYDLSDPSKPVLLKDGLFRNHGFFSKDNVIYLGSDNGLYSLKIVDHEFVFTKLIDEACGEVAINDIDNDGKDEILIIEKMHGDKISLYKDGKKVLTFDDGIQFAHALSDATINGQPVFLCGVRQGEGEIFTISYQDGEYKKEVIDTAVGPANLCSFDHDGKTYIAAANHTKGEFALYTL